MSGKRRSSRRKHDKKEPKTRDEGKGRTNDGEQVRLDDWSGRKRPVRRRFTGPEGVEVGLRVSFERSAYADVVMHAKESLEKEICGVLVGEVCEDDAGLFVEVKAAIRGKGAQQERAHVTFTQETWNSIHKEKDERYPRLSIVGWYHSHPGFGVEISEMDRFIQENFFSSETQVGFVTDPLSGEVALIINSSEGILNVDRFWVDTREHKCYVPRGQSGESEAGEAGGSGPTAEAVERVNTRLSQVIQTVDDLRNSLYRFLLSLGFIICIAVVAAIGFHIYSSFTSRSKPPELRTWAPVLVQIEDKVVQLGVGVVAWEVPDELNATYLRIEQMKRAKEKAEREAAEKAKQDQEAGEKTEGEGSATPEADKEGSQEVSDQPKQPEE
jgi:proteasome lid subunit RPN8/RPN11